MLSPAFSSEHKPNCKICWSIQLDFDFVVEDVSLHIRCALSMIENPQWRKKKTTLQLQNQSPAPISFIHIKKTLFVPLTQKLKYYNIS